MAELVVDTSVVLKWYIPEQHHEAARSLRDDYLDGSFDLIAPALMPFEAINALKYSGHYDDEQLADAAQSLGEYGIELVRFEKTGAVATVAADLDITVYDAAYIALADRFDTTAYTADQALLDALNDEYSEFAEHIRGYS